MIKPMPKRHRALMLAAVMRTMNARHLALATILTNNHAGAAVKLTLYVVAIFGFSMAVAGRHLGWPLAAVGAVGAQLSNIVALQWTALVNPVHVLAASLWIGTLFALVTIAVPRVMSGAQSGEDV